MFVVIGDVNGGMAVVIGDVNRTSSTYLEQHDVLSDEAWNVRMCDFVS